MGAVEQSMNSAVTMPMGDGAALGCIDQYELIKELGGGGFGTVYLAKDTVSGVEVAVKGLPPFVKNNREEMENIRANFALVSRLHHPNIAAALVLHPAKSVTYASEDVRQKLRVLPGDMLMVMEYASGVTLSQWRKQFPERKVPIDKALEITRQVAAALDYAHERKIIHRDIKPANVMVETAADGAVTARVLDFGLAAEIRSSMGRVSQEIHDTSGTRPYMAPEQWSGANQNAETDQYALAVLLYELVVGKVPFASVFDTGDPVIMLTVVTARPPDIPVNLPKAMRLALSKALEKKPEARFASCSDFVAALEGKKVSVRNVRSKMDGVSEGIGGLLTKALVAIALVVAAVGGWWLLGGPHGKDAAARNPQAKIENVEAEHPVGSEGGPPPAAAGDAESKAKEDEERKAAEEERRKNEADRKAKESEARRARESAERKAKAEAEFRAKAEAERLKREENERKAKEEAERKAKEEAERKAKEESLKNQRRQQLYRDLALIETGLDTFAKFEYQDAIRERRDGLSASYKAARAAFEKDDLDNALNMAESLKAPCEELKGLLPVVRAYYLGKAEVIAEREAALAAEASVYATAEYSDTERAFKTASQAEMEGDYVKANDEIGRLKGRYAAVRAVAISNPESLFRKGLAAQKANENETAFALFSKAAAKNHSAALINLGLMHMKGLGAAKSEAEAFECFRKAAGLNNAHAQYLLGGCYAKAIGVKYDKEMSRLWMIMARANGSKGASDFLSKVGWPVSDDEAAAVKEILEAGSSTRSISGTLRQIATECRKATVR